MLLYCRDMEVKKGGWGRIHSEIYWKQNPHERKSLESGAMDVIVWWRGQSRTIDYENESEPRKKKLRKGAGGRGSKNPIGGSGGRGPGGSASSRAVPHRLRRVYRWRFMERSPATATAVTDVANKWRRGIHGVRAWDERWSAPVISMVRRNPAQSKLGFSSISTTNSKKRTYGCHSIFLETWILGNLDIGLDYRGTFFLSGCFPVRIGNRADFGTG